MENNFNVGDKVVFEDLDNSFYYHIGEVSMVDCSGNVIVECKEGSIVQSFTASPETVYDLQGLAVYFDALNNCMINLIDDIGDNNHHLVINKEGKVYVLHASNILIVDTQDNEPEHVVDTVIEDLRELLLKRSQTGISKYGVTLDRTDLKPSDWCQHLLEELLDAAGYVQRLKKDILELESQYDTEQYTTPPRTH